MPHLNDIVELSNRKVATQAGVKKFNRGIGSVIATDVSNPPGGSTVGSTPAQLGGALSSNQASATTNTKVPKAKKSQRQITDLRLQSLADQLEIAKASNNTALQKSVERAFLSAVRSYSTGKPATEILSLLAKISAKAKENAKKNTVKE